MFCKAFLLRRRERSNVMMMILNNLPRYITDSERERRELNCFCLKCNRETFSSASTRFRVCVWSIWKTKANAFERNPRGKHGEIIDRAPLETKLHENLANISRQSFCKSKNTESRFHFAITCCADVTTWDAACSMLTTTKLSHAVQKSEIASDYASHCVKLPDSASRKPMRACKAQPRQE